MKVLVCHNDQPNLSLARSTNHTPIHCNIARYNSYFFYDAVSILGEPPTL